MPAELKLVKDGVPEIDPEAVAMAEGAAAALVAAVKAGGGFWLLLDTDEAEVKFYGADVEIAAFAEEAARRHKLAALGLGE